MTRRKTDRGERGPRGYQFDGILLIDKNEGETSFDIVKSVRKVLNLRKVGHAGTLDPFATGLLIVLLGQGTKLSRYLMAEEKRYVASIRLGVETDTLDPTGRIVCTKDIPVLKPEEIEKRILMLVGDIEQVPPAYSAVSFKGKRAYELARKGVSVKLPKRVVTIRSLDILSINIPVITIDVVCSGGTYIRSLALDIGRHLDSVAHLSSLRRLSIGRFHVKDALNPARMRVSEQGSLFRDNAISLNDALPGVKELQVDLKTAERIRNGYRPAWHEVANGEIFHDIQKGFLKIVNGQSLVAIMEISGFPGDRKEEWLENIRVFN